MCALMMMMMIGSMSFFILFRCCSIPQGNPQLEQRSLFAGPLGSCQARKVSVRGISSAMVETWQLLMAGQGENPMLWKSASLVVAVV